MGHQKKHPWRVEGWDNVERSFKLCYTRGINNIHGNGLGVGCLCTNVGDLYFDQLWGKFTSRPFNWSRMVTTTVIKIPRKSLSRCQKLKEIKTTYCCCSNFRCDVMCAMFSHEDFKECSARVVHFPGKEFLQNSGGLKTGFIWIPTVHIVVHLCHGRVSEGNQTR